MRYWGVGAAGEFWKRANDQCGMSRAMFCRLLEKRSKEKRFRQCATDEKWKPVSKTHNALSDKSKRMPVFAGLYPSALRARACECRKRISSSEHQRLVYCSPQSRSKRAR
jgi:Tankyrase binding protein C terminal domain